MSKRQPFSLSRRQVMRGLLAAGAFGITSRYGTGCTPASNTTQSNVAGGGGNGEPLIVGFIYVGPKDDFGYNQAHAEGAAGIAKISGVQIIEEANVPETNAVQETMRSMIELDGAKVLFPTSFGYFDPHIINLAKEFPDVQFFHAGGLYREGLPDNIGSYYGYIDEAQYVAGIVAAHTSRSGKLGFVAAKPIPQVLRNINSFTLGARSVKPEITTQVLFTGEWAEPVKEAEATNSMADQGIDVVTCHVDSPKVVIETAERRGIYTSGYHANQVALAPKGYLTGAEWDWTKIYTDYVTAIQEGKTLMNGGIPHLVRGGLQDGFCKLSDYGAAVGDQAKQEADAAKAKFMDGSMVIYAGEIKDNQGKSVIAKDKALPQKDPELEQMNWLVEGVIGSVGA
ncbi:BMP family ABC transporter substrate-binding protein [Desertifilum sp. FACHB-1129]|uniref:BMP family ABC transporter substrate-binding protein n=1 Tax=Desertifilum tharense IPPAS B-1220 TaxID=1781255 RepID=A0A1E5QII5_9CYAN|nr:MULTISPECIES: BMP family ABC transporter substrate-binding protein [Desertifilum]MDA0210141.1 BMP family ABC transporter substrate-binding protein [Cyanobacteria bacterium FC1]MBD2312554.1 BMP family ABC transporter substrate-binding protein [Desertifilum sp. FACHB-1129]MBD2320546.1 BMP family ABC transporter substrate-binding protein [Desertifilum sp. FACHB-866]MBD2330674.1 BMP family ABC transporter substrate-binding protein [Desertifilum sp. FACHB-868]OEJ74470.1 BMP family ABC transporte